MYLDALNRQPGGIKQERGGSSGKFVSKSLQDLSWRGFLKRIFKCIKLVECPCAQRNFPSVDALIRHIERSHPEDKDSITFHVSATVDQSTSSHDLGDTLERKYGKGTVSKELCQCGKRFECYSDGVFTSGSAVMVYSDGMVHCDNCEWKRLEDEVKQG